MHEVKITSSNGHSSGTSVELDGKILTDVTAVSFSIAAGGVTKVRIEFEASQVILTGNALNEI